MATSTRNVISASKVQGTDVRNAQGENLGHIEDVVIDKTSGKIAYAVLSFGGFLGMGDKHFALPWSTLTYSIDQEAYLLNIDKETLKRAPGYDDTSSDLSDETWGQAIHDHYKVSPYWEDTDALVDPDVGIGAGLATGPRGYRS